MFTDLIPLMNCPVCRSPLSIHPETDTSPAEVIVGSLRCQQDHRMPEGWRVATAALAGMGINDVGFLGLERCFNPMVESVGFRDVVVTVTGEVVGDPDRSTESGVFPYPGEPMKEVLVVARRSQPLGSVMEDGNTSLILRCPGRGQTETRGHALERNRPTAGDHLRAPPKAPEYYRARRSPFDEHAARWRHCKGYRLGRDSDRSVRL